MALWALLMMSPSPIGPSRQPQDRCSTRQRSIVWWRIAETRDKHSPGNQPVTFFHIFQQSYLRQPARSWPVTPPAWHAPGPAPLRYLHPLNQQRVAAQPQECSLSSKGTDTAAWKKMSWYFGYLETSQKRGVFVKIFIFNFQIKDPY